MKNIRQEIIYNQKQLEERLGYWQNKLRLNDWIISIEIRRGRALRIEDKAATVAWVVENKVADIQIIDPLDYPEDAWFPQDMDWEIVHELLHLHLVPVTDNSDEQNSIDIEQIIESITYGLIALERKA